MHDWYSRSMTRTAAPTDQGGADMAVKGEIDNLTKYVHDNILPQFYQDVSGKVAGVLRPLAQQLVSSMTQAATARGIPFNAGHNTTFMTLIMPMAIHTLLSNPALANITNQMANAP